MKLTKKNLIWKNLIYILREIIFVNFIVKIFENHIIETDYFVLISSMQPFLNDRNPIPSEGQDEFSMSLS